MDENNSIVLVTGANGFIGQHVVRKLKKDYEVHAVVRNPVDFPELGVVYHEVNLAENWDSTLLPYNTKHVIHLAQSKRYRDFPSGAEDMRCVNIDSTAKLLDWALVNGVESFTFASTANVYGKVDGLISEDHSPVPDSYYGASKLAAEHLVQQYRSYFRANILRLFTVYGPMQKRMLIANIIDSIKNGKEITLAQGKGIYLTPVYVDDVVHIVKQLISSYGGSKSSYLLNVCGESVVSLTQIVGIVEGILGVTAKKMATDGAVSSLTGYNGELRRVLSECQLVDIESGLERTLHFQSRRGMS